MLSEIKFKSCKGCKLVNRISNTNRRQELKIFNVENTIIEYRIIQ